MNDIEYIVQALKDADKKVYHYQCPYLALADTVGYTSLYTVHSLPSSFTRLSMRKLLLTCGINNRKLSRMIWLMVENGHSLSFIAEYIEFKDYKFKSIKASLK